jgi:NAD(P)-dependent dehydrogenase (short-subunit alcohol dehydrogenase family)
MKGLQNKRVVVTGGASGIGRATALRLVAEGCRVAVIDRDVPACAVLEQEGLGLAAVLVGDVSKEAEVSEAFERLDDLWGGLDVLINNAGISSRRGFLEISPAEWRETLETNLTGQFLVARQAATRMLAGQGGVILNMASLNAHIGCPYYADYNASKAGVVELTRTMALELAPRVRVLAVSPGAVRTPMQGAEYTEQMFAELEAKIPLRRQADPEEIAALFAFLASDEAAFMTGATVVIDGGESAGGLASQYRSVE